MSHLFGQTEKAGYKTAARKFETFYNATAYDSIYALFSDKMKEALSFDKLSDFLTDLHSQAGKITKKRVYNISKKLCFLQNKF